MIGLIRLAITLVTILDKIQPTKKHINDMKKAVEYCTLIKKEIEECISIVEKQEKAVTKNE